MKGRLRRRTGEQLSRRTGERKKKGYFSRKAAKNAKKKTIFFDRITGYKISN